MKTFKALSASCIKLKIVALSLSLSFGNSIPDNSLATAAAEVDAVAATFPPLFPPLPPGYYTLGRLSYYFSCASFIIAKYYKFSI
jgi:hypothetical protein